MTQVLIVSAKSAERASWREACGSFGHGVSEASGPGDAATALERGAIDLVLVDLDLPRGAGWRLLEEHARRKDGPRVLAWSAEANVDDAVAAMQAGAAHFMERPRDEDLCRAALEQALATGPELPAAEECRRPADLLATEALDLESMLSGDPLVGRSGSMRRVQNQLERVARTPNTTTLVTGESGAGKEVVARAIHDQSARATGPFVAINCAALADSLVEAELFGYEPGAFTGGHAKGRKGLIAAAEGGTLLLDEIGELAPGLQAKLLRVLQERCYRRLGGAKDIAMDVRIVAATNRDLAAMVDEGSFREDLYYRLNVLSIQVPPLRERREDIPALAARFLVETAKTLGREFSGYSADALELLGAQPWMGNVRELKNTVERAAIFAEGDRIESADLFGAQEPLAASPRGNRLPSATGASCSDTASFQLLLDSVRLRDVEQRLIEHVLERVGGNRSQAARELGINRTTLYNKLRSYGLAS